MQNKKTLSLVFLLFFIEFALLADQFQEGEKLFSQNKPAEAIPLLDASLKLDPTNEKAALYLGISFQQTGKNDEAIIVFRKYLPNAKLFRYLFYYNIGNSYYALKKMVFAEEMYTEAVKENPQYASSYLNRANARMNQQKYKEAVEDFRMYLSINPSTSQKSDIEKIIALLEKNFQDAAAAEEKRIADEIANKLAQEQKAAEIKNSLDQASQETQSMSAGNEGVQGYEDDNGLE